MDNTTRTAYMQLVLNHTYSMVPIIAIQQGSLTGAWEKAIAERLEADYRAGFKLPISTLGLLGLYDQPISSALWLRAAYAIRETKVDELETIKS
jgi:hypothetical protein